MKFQMGDATDILILLLPVVLFLYGLINLPKNAGCIMGSAHAERRGMYVFERSTSNLTLALKMGNQPSPSDDANNLLRQLLSSYNPDYGLGHMSPSIYDTAWVSMVLKNGSWLFPSAFQYILKLQAGSGAWESQSPSPIDAILNTLASLLTLKVHNTGGQFDESISRATAFLSSSFGSWDVSSTDRVGFEVIVPSLLNALSKLGVDFSFPQRLLLMDLNDATLARIPPRAVYDLGTPLLHSLEGLIGHIDFDQVAHHKRNGSFMASPASTAAYLMNASTWDDECEAYLAAVLSRSEPHDEGSVPCAWPTTFFELSWASLRQM